MITEDIQLTQNQSHIKLNLNQGELLHSNLVNEHNEKEKNTLQPNIHELQPISNQYEYQQNNSNCNNQETLINSQTQQQKISAHQQQQQQLSLQNKLKTNPYLNQMFKHFCNMTYADTKKNKHQSIGQIISTLSLNKFMIFSKQFHIDSIIKTSLNNQSNNQHHNKHKTQQSPTLTIKKTSSSSPKMLQIPVKNINNTQKILTKLYRKNTQKYDQMTYQEFIAILYQIYSIFLSNIDSLYQGENITDKRIIEEKYLTDVLVIKDAKKFEEKMANLKILFKGAISYHQEPVRKSTSFLHKKLVIHGGRSPQEMKKQLEIYQAPKIDKKQTWIDKQPQNMGAYSKSRVFYRPNPSKVYQTNDVIRLARKQAGRTMTQSLFDYHAIMSQKRQTLHRNQTMSFSKIFEDKTNKFNEKLQKLKQKYAAKNTPKQVKTQQSEQTIDKDDEILERYFENERKIYGDENY